MSMRAFLAGLLCAIATGAASAAPLQICATTPDLGDLARQVGGDDVAVTVFAKPSEDPHFIEAKPGFITRLSRADAFVQTGLDLEVGWAPVLLQNARNARVLPGAPGFVDASAAITPMDVPTGEIDRSMGDVHPGGNPHYLLDPEAGRAVARLLAERFASLRPDRADAFRERLAAFEKRLDEAEAGWSARLAPFRGGKVVVDHNLWPYFAARYGLEIEAFLEPKPGMAPTTKHLAEVVERMKRENLRVLLASPYFDPRHAAFVVKQTGATMAALAHQVGSRPGTDDYISMIDHNTREVAEAFSAR